MHVGLLGPDGGGSDTPHSQLSGDRVDWWIGADDLLHLGRSKVWSTMASVSALWVRRRITCFVTRLSFHTSDIHELACLPPTFLSSTDSFERHVTLLDGAFGVAIQVGNQNGSFPFL